MKNNYMKSYINMHRTVVPSFYPMGNSPFWKGDCGSTQAHSRIFLTWMFIATLKMRRICTQQLKIYKISVTEKRETLEKQPLFLSLTAVRIDNKKRMHSLFSFNVGTSHLSAYNWIIFSSVLSHNLIGGLSFSALLLHDSIDNFHHTSRQLLALGNDRISSSQHAAPM